MEVEGGWGRPYPQQESSASRSQSSEAPGGPLEPQLGRGEAQSQSLGSSGRQSSAEQVAYLGICTQSTTHSQFGNITKMVNGMRVCAIEQKPGGGRGWGIKKVGGGVRRGAIQSNRTVLKIHVLEQ